MFSHSRGPEIPLLSATRKLIRGLYHQLELGFVVLPMPSPNHLPLAGKKTVARRYGVSKSWLLCGHFMTRSCPKRGGTKMVPGASAFCREGPSSRENRLQRFDENATNHIKSAIRPTLTNTTKTHARALQSCPITSWTWENAP